MCNKIEAKAVEFYQYACSAAVSLSSEEPVIMNKELPNALVVCTRNTAVIVSIRF